MSRFFWPMDGIGIRALALAAACGAAFTADAQAQTTVQSIVDSYGNAAVQGGLSVGVEVAVVIGNSAPQFSSYGVTDTTSLSPPTPNTIFYIGSMSKVLTTNLLGQAVNAGQVSLSTPLASYAAVLGTLPANGGAVTLGDLGDFTSGYPNLAPTCRGSKTPGTTGCVPNGDPSLTQYTAGNFATYFQKAQLAAAPPASYSYSTFGVGLVGLLLAATPGVPLDDTALTAYGNLLTQALTGPLGMSSTNLYVPSSQLGLLASGYQPATGGVSSSNGIITASKVTNPGVGYVSPPAVTIFGGNGSGATATATLNATGGVASVSITNAGSGYIPDGRVSFSGGGATSPAVGTLIIQNGIVTGVLLSNGGTGYTSAPTVTFAGGRIKGTNATGVAQIVHGSVVSVSITNAGSGYVTPLEIAFQPPPPVALQTPIWAPASALASSVSDMAIFAAAALGHTQVGSLAVPPAITQAFSTAETAYACQGVNPSLTGCGGYYSGLGWRIQANVPATIAKDGAVNGYSSYMVLMPNSDTAVVVLSNSYNGSAEATTIGNGIIYGLYFAGLLPTH